MAQPSIPTNRIQQVDYADLPEHIVPGMGDMASGDDTNAVTMFNGTRGTYNSKKPIPITITRNEGTDGENRYPNPIAMAPVGSGNNGADNKVIGG